MQIRRGTCSIFGKWGMGNNYSSENTPMLWLSGSTASLHANTHTHTSSTTIIPGHSSTPILHYHLARLLWRINTYTQTQNRSFFPLSHKRLGHPLANDHIRNDEKPELFVQKLIDHILLFCSWRRLPVTHKRWRAGNRFVCHEGLPVCARIPIVMSVHVSVWRSLCV